MKRTHYCISYLFKFHAHKNEYLAKKLDLIISALYSDDLKHWRESQTKAATKLNKAIGELVMLRGNASRSSDDLYLHAFAARDFEDYILKVKTGHQKNNAKRKL